MNYCTVNNLHKRDGVPRDFMRKLIALGKMPGFRSGNRFYVDREAFLQMLKDGTLQDAGGQRQ